MHVNQNSVQLLKVDLPAVITIQSRHEIVHHMPAQSATAQLDYCSAQLTAAELAIAASVQLQHEGVHRRSITRINRRR
jgi:electron transfer flavoprotein alpha/beta subunit